MSSSSAAVFPSRQSTLCEWGGVAYKTINSLDPPLQLIKPKIKQILAETLSGHFHLIATSLNLAMGIRRRSWIGRGTTLGAAYAPTRRRIISPPDDAQFLVDCIIS